MPNPMVSSNIESDRHWYKRIIYIDKHVLLMHVCESMHCQCTHTGLSRKPNINDLFGLWEYPWLVQSKSLHGLIRLGSILKYLFFQVLILGDSLFCIGVHIHYIVIPMCYFYNSWNWQRIRCRVSPCIAIETHCQQVGLKIYLY